MPGLSVEVLEFADRLLLRNHTGKTVTVYGYSGEPYARVLPDGAAEQNMRSPAVYLNTNFYANVTVPPSASATAPPQWEAVDRTGQFEWHDHRIHWMSPVTPPEVKDTSKRTKIFGWTRADQGRQPARARSRANCSGCPRAPRRPPARSSRASLIVLLGLATRGGRQTPARQRRGPARREPPAATDEPRVRQRGVVRRCERSRRRIALADRRCPGGLLAARAGHAPPALRPRPTARHLARRRAAPSPPSRREVIFKFNQTVGGTLGAVRVYNAQGDEVDNLDVSHPGGNEHWMGVGLKPHLPDGTYTATYRVISADTHIVYGGLVFNIGHPGAAPRYTVAGLIGRNKAGRVTKVAFGVVRALDYLSIALMIGGLLFMQARVGPGAGRRSAGPEPRWSLASGAFARRARPAAAGGGRARVCSSSVLGILLQGATAAGVSLWSSLKATVLENTLESRFGWVWALRALDWLLLGALLLGARAAGASACPGSRV